LSIGNQPLPFIIEIENRLALMKVTKPWITYRTRFLVKAKQLTTSLTFTDVLGRPHSGRKGDYLVESSDGVLRIAPRQIFEDIYVPLQAGQDETSAQPNSPPLYETLLLEETSLQRQTLPHQRTIHRRDTPAILSLSPHLTRKSPQPYRDRRNSSPGLRSL
jgi:hypothetical protein